MLGGEPGMHELSLAQHLLDLALQHAARARAERVTQLYLVVGEMAPLEETSLSFYWDQISLGTPAEGSSVRVRRLSLQLNCLDCGQSFEPGDRSWSCPACGSERVRLQGGDECYLEAIDVEAALTAEAPA
jgi:hydrogenase nickel incorporation protein HypA/HybF